MISVVLCFGERGDLVSARAAGHAEMGIAGTDIVCAAVSILFRTTISVLSREDGSFRVEAATAGRGNLSIRVTGSVEADIPFLVFSADFLREGLSSLSREYPNAVELRIEASCTDGQHTAIRAR